MNYNVYFSYIRRFAAYKALKDFKLLISNYQPNLLCRHILVLSFMHQESTQLALLIKCHDKEKCRERKARSNGRWYTEDKVGCQLMWNFRNNRLMGWAMTPKVPASLNDIIVYTLLQSSADISKQTLYILTFLWRILTSEFDIVGPVQIFWLMGAARGKLDAVNYVTASAACLVRQSGSSHHSRKGYRDETLHTTYRKRCATNTQANKKFIIHFNSNILSNYGSYFYLQFLKIIFTQLSFKFGVLH